MQYETINDLPKTVRNLPKPAKTLYLKAFNSAWDELADSGSDSSRDKAAQEAAWSAVRAEYEKDEDTGEWIRKGDDSGVKYRHSPRHRRSRGSAATQPRAHA